MRDQTRKEMSASDPKKLLVEAGLDLFGKYSFDGASTRMLAQRAQVNLAAIQYHFGSKQGLYLAVAEHIVEQIDELLGPMLAKVQEALKKEYQSKEQSFQLLSELLEFSVIAFLGHPQTGKWLTIITHEQLCPTEAFSVLYEGFMRPMDEALFGLVAHIMGRGKDDREVRLRVYTIMGEVLVFHVSPSSVRRGMKWDKYSTHNLEAIRNVIMENLKTMFSIYTNSLSPDPMGEKRNNK